MDLCKDRFYQMWRNTGAVGNASMVWQKIKQQYGQEHRSYHNLSHIHHCLNQLELVWQEPSDPFLISWALFFHDYFYDIGNNWNEFRSGIQSMCTARNAKLSLKFTIASGILVFATKNHQVTETPYALQKDLEILLDLDLAVLGKPWAQYDQTYRKPVRKEYESVPWKQFAERRRKILELFLKREKLYFRPFFHERYEKQARSNLEHEIERLKTLDEQTCYAED